MAIPDFQTLMLPLLQLTAGGQTRTTEAVEALSNQFQLSDEERSVLLPSGKQATMANRVHWAISYLGKAGLIQRVQRGSYVISDEGKKLLKNSPERIDIKFLMRFPKFQEFRTTAKQEKDRTPNSAPITENEGTPEEKIDDAAEELDSTLRSDVRDKARSLTPSAFEKLIVDLMLAMGYGTSGHGTHVGKSGNSRELSTKKVNKRRLRHDEQIRIRSAGLFIKEYKEDHSHRWPPTRNADDPIWCRHANLQEDRDQED